MNPVRLRPTGWLEISKVGNLFSDIVCGIISCLVVGIFMPKNSIVTKFCHLVLGGPVFVPDRVYEYR